MQERSTIRTNQPSVLQFRQDLQTQLRQHVRETIEVVLEEELTAALGSARHERTERREGYRHGALEILGSYLAGANSRRIRTALKPLLGERHLSWSAVSRIVARLKALFATWQTRDLRGERYAMLFLDGFHLKVRLARRVIAVPVLAALGVTETGEKRLVELRLAVTEAATSWSGLLLDLQRRGLPAPLLVVTDGHAGLKKALEAWSRVRVSSAAPRTRAATS